MKYYAHLDKVTGKRQELYEHLQNTSTICSILAEKIGLAETGELLGLLHDLGKYSTAFQEYLQTSCCKTSYDFNNTGASDVKGKIDHSTAGAQYIWGRVKNGQSKSIIAAQLLSICIASHHSGLIDCISIEGKDKFSERINKKDNNTYFEEVSENCDSIIIKKINETINKLFLSEQIPNYLKHILKKFHSDTNIQYYFQAGLMIRMLFSCLIDADRIDSAGNFVERANGKYIEWSLLLSRLEENLLKYDNNSNIAKIRNAISQECSQKASGNLGVYTLTVPTGGGKSLASLRFALLHAQKHRLDRIIYIVPYTSIIDQNADDARRILEIEEGERGHIVLEYHSNLTPNAEQFKNELVSENWDAPVLYTTSVQFLETLFSSGTSSVRRMHQLARSVIIFDEIQTLPIKTIHMFCNAINYLTNFCNSTVVLCTATQPLLNKVSEEKGRIPFNIDSEIIPDVSHLFNELQRVCITDRTKGEKWSAEQIAELAAEEVKKENSCLIIVNTKKAAKIIYEACKKKSMPLCYHLSTNMCPAHRLDILNEIKNKLEIKAPLICVSTQLIEAGVNIDFGTVIRSVAGLDSIVQAAGRCNRNGIRERGNVYIINPGDEKIDGLYDIKIGKEITERILHEIKDKSSGLPNDLTAPEVMERYFQYYFYNRADEMGYPVNRGRNDELLNMLSVNSKSVGEYKRVNGDKNPSLYFMQGFMEANKAFEVIDAPTQGVIVPYKPLNKSEINENELGDGEQIIADLCGAYEVKKQKQLLHAAQKFSVNLYSSDINNLIEEGALNEVQPGTGILFLRETYYNLEFGVSLRETETMEPLQY